MYTTSTTNRSRIKGTASMLGDPEAHHCGVASVSRPTSAVPCAAEGLEWVPAVEQGVVPVVQRRLCLQCPVRQWCLETAVATDSPGYWAGTTSRQRRALQRGGQVTVELVDEGQRVEAVVHPPGEGSLSAYRNDRCRCQECTGCNTDARRRERAKQAHRRPTGRAA